MAHQQRLFTVAEPRLSASAPCQRVDLSPTAYLELFRGFVHGDDGLFDHLQANTRWTESSRPMYDRVVDVPRLTAVLPADGPGHPLLTEVATWLSHRYTRPVDRLSLALYRDGRDSVAWHGDRMGEQLEDCVVAILSLRGPRRLRIRPAGGGPSLHSYNVGLGDLLIMGGSAQRDFEHGVAKVSVAVPRMSVMFRSRRKNEPKEQ